MDMQKAPRGCNTPDANISRCLLEDAMMASLPGAITDWLRYDAPCDFDVRKIYHSYLDGVPAEQILEDMRGEARVQTMRSYGDLHPQLPYAQREFAMGRNPYANENTPKRRAA